MPPVRSRRPLLLLAALATLVLLVPVAGCGLLGRGPDTAAAEFLKAWSTGDDRGAAALTDDPAAAADQLAATRGGLGAATLVAEAGQVRTATDRAVATVNYRWDLGAGRTWNYSGDVELVQAARKGSAEPGWVVHWAPKVVHPQLASGQRLMLRAEPARPAPVVDRAGLTVLGPTPVVTVQLDRLAAPNLNAVTAALATALTPIDSEITQQTITEGAARTPDRLPYSVAVLRDTDYQRVKGAIHGLPGVRFSTSERLLAPNAGYGRAVLPAIRTEMAGQLDGVAGWSVQAVDRAGNQIASLVEQPPQPGSTVAVGLDQPTQDAAEGAVETETRQAMLVAVSASTGDLLAVAQNQQADAVGAPALAGRYPPGSTFKIVTAAAALGGLSLTADSPVACPGVSVIGGRPVPNENRFDLGTVSLRTAFARSCNTTFAKLATELGPDALPAAALRFGLGADYVLPGLTTVTGSVPGAPDIVQRAENGFGQGQVLASPLGMALVAATVARGAPVVPQLIRERPTQVVRSATDPDPAGLGQLRAMMRAVVTEGTGSRLAGLGEVFGKTGTAEYTDDGRAHGWFVGYRGDVAFAVLVTDAGSSDPAVEVAARFLSGMR